MATTACTANAQVPQQVTSAEFFAAKVNGHTNLQDFATHSDDRDRLKVTMGQPTSEVCETTMVETTCTIEWDGISVLYTDIAGNVEEDLTLFTLTLTGSASFLDYGGTTVRVGDPISRLRQIFPEAYENRGNDCPASPGYPSCNHAVLVNHSDFDSLMFTYNPSTLVVEEISWARNIL
ncbi:MAG: hypothetical protein RQ745_13950 [Longimicrobiales bacterium]|nr:hypothetical protein [Longimicrobiales bacterium]